MFTLRSYCCNDKVNQIISVGILNELNNNILLCIPFVPSATVVGAESFAVGPGCVVVGLVCVAVGQGLVAVDQMRCVSDSSRSVSVPKWCVHRGERHCHLLQDQTVESTNKHTVIRVLYMNIHHLSLCKVYTICVYWFSRLLISYFLHKWDLCRLFSIGILIRNKTLVFINISYIFFCSCLVVES